MYIIYPVGERIAPSPPFNTKQLVERDIPRVLYLSINCLDLLRTVLVLLLWEMAHIIVFKFENNCLLPQRLACLRYLSTRHKRVYRTPTKQQTPTAISYVNLMCLFFYRIYIALTHFCTLHTNLISILLSYIQRVTKSKRMFEKREKKCFVWFFECQ